jgi:putative endonuclease
MYTVYVLYPEKNSKTYTGYSSDFAKRFASHNEFGKKDWATRFRPWIVLKTEEYETKGEAMSREKFLKSGHGRLLIRQWIGEQHL